MGDKDGEQADELTDRGIEKGKYRWRIDWRKKKI